MREENGCRMGKDPVSVIAVFGSNEGGTPAAAELVRHQIACQKGGVLTGGQGLGGPVVKDQAIEGCRRAILEAHVGRWVGVPKRQDGGDTTSPDGPGRSHVIRTPYGDERNYLEAWLCDVAICFHGKGGTTSELAFCIALGIPVVLVGDAWVTEYPMSRAPNDLETLRRLARARVMGIGERTIDQLIRQAYDVLPRCVAVHRHCPVPTSPIDAATVVETAHRLVASRADRQSVLPVDIASEVSDYFDWLGDSDPWLGRE